MKSPINSVKFYIDVYSMAQSQPRGSLSNDMSGTTISCCPLSRRMPNNSGANVNKFRALHLFERAVVLKMEVSVMQEGDRRGD